MRVDDMLRGKLDRVTAELTAARANLAAEVEHANRVAGSRDYWRDRAERAETDRDDARLDAEAAKALLTFHGYVVQRG